MPKKTRPKVTLALDPDQQAAALAAVAATTFVRKALAFSELYEHAGAEVLALAVHLENTRLAHVTDPGVRRAGADAQAAFLVAMAIAAGAR